MPDDDLIDPDEKIDQAIRIVKQRNWERYGVYEVDERYVRSLPEWRLDAIIKSRVSSAAA